MAKYPEIKNLVKIAKILDELKIPYYVTGGFAVSIYGRPRFTADIDIIIKMSHHQKGEFAKKIGKIFPKGYIDKDQIDTALSRQGEFNIIDPESGLKVDFWIAKKDGFEEECFKTAIDKDIDYKVKFISPENLIISKLIWYRGSGSTRQLEDIASVMDIQKKLDMVYLAKWIKKLDLETQFQDLKKLK